MAIFDTRRLDSIFHPHQPAPHAPEVHTPAPVSATNHAPIPRAIPVSEPAPAPVKTPTPAPVPTQAPAPKTTPTPAPQTSPGQTPATVPAQTPTTTPGLTEAEQHDLITHKVEVLKENKTILKPGQKGPEVVVLQQQLKQLGLHVDQSGVMDKATEGYIMALQTGGGLGADGVVGPKTLDQILKLDKAPDKPVPAGDQASAQSDNVDHMPDDPKLAAVYLYNRQRVKNTSETLNAEQQRDMEQFIKNWPSTL